MIIEILIEYKPIKIFDYGQEKQKNQRLRFHRAG